MACLLTAQDQTSRDLNNKSTLMDKTGLLRRECKQAGVKPGLLHALVFKFERKRHFPFHYTQHYIYLFDQF